jgi:hypothetical protein
MLGLLNAPMRSPEEIRSRLVGEVECSSRRLAPRTGVPISLSNLIRSVSGGFHECHRAWRTAGLVDQNPAKDLGEAVVPGKASPNERQIGQGLGLFTGS